MKTIFQLAVWISLVFGPVFYSNAQIPTPPPDQQYQPLDAADLDKLLGPIALYPDPLIAEILPAATLPTQIVLADRYLTSGGDPSQIDSQPWDPNVQALAHYPTVLKYLDDNLNWTAAMGQAFLYQQDDVMSSIQRLRSEAQNYGNLQSSPQQQVIDDSGTIEIVPENPDLLYIPEYDPDAVYYGPPAGPPYITFSIGWVVGGWLNCDFDWHHRHLIVWDHDHPRPQGWWHETGDRRAGEIDRGSHNWHSPSGGDARSHTVDRGWNNPNLIRSGPSNSREPVPQRDNHGNETHPTAPRQSEPNFHPTPAQDIPRQQQYTAPQQHFTAPQQQYTAPQQRFTAPQAPAPAPHADAYIGIQSQQETRAYSQRGAESMQSMPHAAPPQERSAPAAHYSAPSGGGGGGGSHGGGGGGGGHH